MIFSNFILQLIPYIYFMKTLMHLLLVILLVFKANLVYSQAVSIAAIVWNFNRTPSTEVTNPSFLNEVWDNWIDSSMPLTIDLNITDFENNSIYFTITPSIWAVNISNWWPLSTNWWRVIQFDYLPVSWENSVNITITANDWYSYGTKSISFSTY